MKYNKELINKVYITLQETLPIDFGKCYAGLNDENEYIHCYTKIITALREIDKEIFMDSGASKAVIISPNFGEVVIKIPFTGCYVLSEKYENMESAEEAEALTFDEKFIFNKFCGGGGKYDNDYCAVEATLYKELKELNYDCFVAETEVLGWIDDKCILLQEFVTPEDDDFTNRHFSKASYKSSSSIKEDFDSASMMSEDWIAALVEYYGEELCKDFFDYCEDDGYPIVSDAHGMNYGYRADGTPAFLDFSDYGS